MLILSMKKAKRLFGKMEDLSDNIVDSPPINMPKKDYEVLKRILSAKNMADIEDISDEEIIQVSEYLDKLAEFLCEKTLLEDPKLLINLPSIPSAKTKKRRIL